MPSKPKKLYYVTMTANAYVLAEDSHQAQRIAENEVRDGCNLRSHAALTSKTDKVAEDWQGCLVFGHKGDMTVEEAVVLHGKD